MDNFKGFKTSAEAVTEHTVEIGLELEVEPEMRLDHCDLMVKLQRMRRYLLEMSKDCSFLRWKLLLVKMLYRLLKWQPKV